MNSEVFGIFVIGALRESGEEERNPKKGSVISAADKSTAQDVTVIVLGAGCEFTIIGPSFNNIKFLCKKGISKAVDSSQVTSVVLGCMRIDTKLVFSHR
ncbi:hypothetical protein N7520_006628 [Penicillium odoratum]|uniref:uncharacterized protein n=1 Tax=Penicillium odoratum TaxID=1167516 RepID=UPI0025490364|nr:uncharacterized protein N7520_006628 [Penicillium odoratum]KAJ5759472.1 hypothetical protein N7520_006628 [Penicillium odoratum]